MIILSSFIFYKKSSIEYFSFSYPYPTLHFCFSLSSLLSILNAFKAVMVPYKLIPIWLHWSPWWSLMNSSAQRIALRDETSICNFSQKLHEIYMLFFKHLYDVLNGIPSCSPFLKSISEVRAHVFTLYIDKVYNQKIK